MTHEEVLEELRLADPVPVDAQRPETAWSSAVVLQSIETRRRTMQTARQEVEKPAARARSSRTRAVLVAAGAMVVTILVVGGVIATVGGTSDDPAIGAGPVASGGAGFEGVFAEDGATLDGPEAVTAGTYDFILTNGSDLTASLIASRFSDEAALAEELATLEVGENQALQGPGHEFGSGFLVATFDVAAGTDKTQTVLLAKGLYVFDWLTFDDFGITDHIWRVKVIEVGE
jgi:hypothetical protein